MSDVAQRVMQNRSMLNPVDRSMMKQDGQLDPNMSVVDFLKQMGVDPNGPVSQLTSLWQNQSAMANPANKMQAISGAPPSPQGQGPEAGPSGGGGSLSSLLGGMNG